MRAHNVTVTVILHHYKMRQLLFFNPRFQICLNVPTATPNEECL